MYKLKDRFTTHHGHLIPGETEWSITPEMLAKYGPVMPDGKGCATCIFVRLEGGPSKEVFFETTGGHHETHPIDAQGWAHTTMANPGSGYNPNNNVGPWSVQAAGAPSQTVDGIGLPLGEHVTTWVVFLWDPHGEDIDEGPDPIEPPVGQPHHIQVYVDGVLICDYWTGEAH